MIDAVVRRTLLPLTLPASWLYRAGVEARNRLYERGAVEVRQLPASVVSVGNLTIGGSGKTPLVALVSRHFLSKGRKAAVLSRGYHREHHTPFLVVSDGREVFAGVDEAGDEPLELARSIEGLVVAVGADRFRTGLEVIRRLGPHVLVLDDGFQHRRLFRNLDLVCIDSGESEESLRLLPAGRLREPLGSLNRASALVWTRWRPGRPEEALGSRVLGALRVEIPVFRSVQRTSGFSRVDGEELLPAGGLAGEPVALLSAVARPERVREDLERSGARVVWSVARRDHHRWQRAEVARLLDRARLRGARAVVTTGKDAVKLSGMGRDSALPVYQMGLECEIVEREPFGRLLDSVGER